MNVDRRRKNREWFVTDEQGATYSHLRDGCLLAVAMDIRDELQKLNSLLHCHNFVVIPDILRTIRRNTTKPKKKAVKK